MKIEKIITLSEHKEDLVRQALYKEHCNPERERFNLPYLKYDLTRAIVEAILEGHSERKKFYNILYHTINKDVLKRVNYGIRSTGKLPKDFLDSLSNWEAVYFFRGRWKIREPNLEEPIIVLTSRHLLEGVRELYKDHYVRKAKGEYISNKTFPEDEEVKKQCRNIIECYERGDFDVSRETKEHVVSRELAKSFYSRHPEKANNLFAFLPRYEERTKRMNEKELDNLYQIFCLKSSKR